VTIHFEEGSEATVEISANDSLRVELIRALEPGYQPMVGELIAGAPAAEAGIQSGDIIESIGGKPIGTWAQLIAAVEARPGEPTAIGIERDGRSLTLQVTPRSEMVAVAGGGEREVGRIGIGESPRSMPRANPGVGAAMGYGLERTWGTARMITKVLGDLVTGKVSARSLGGPILVGQLSGQVARIGLEAFLGFMALFSVNLAVLNLLPIPVLDGGHLLFLGIEAVRGRAISLENRMRIMQVGFVIVLAIMVWAVGNDILRLFGI
jgi:regulator of sigma E protease